jgi:hypothetical protein
MTLYSLLLWCASTHAVEKFPGTQIILPAGTFVELVETQWLESDLPVGTPVEFKVAENVVIDGKIAIAAEAPAQGHISATRPMKIGLVSAEVPCTAISLDWVTGVDGQKLPIKGEINRKPIKVGLFHSSHIDTGALIESPGKTVQARLSADAAVFPHEMKYTPKNDDSGLLPKSKLGASEAERTEVLVPAGVRIRLVESSKWLAWDTPIGTPVDFKVLEEVVVNGCVVVSENAAAQGHTTSRLLPPLKPSINISLDWVTCADGTRLPLHGEYISRRIVYVSNEIYRQVPESTMSQMTPHLAVDATIDSPGYVRAKYKNKSAY